MQTNVDSAIILSVIIPTCNRNNTLPRAIYSVLSQPVTGLEVIIVNDTDNPISNEILNIAKSYPVIFVTNPGKRGAASARNYGVSIAKGTYITFLDDDDIYLPGRLNNMLSVMIQGQYMMVSSGRFYETGDFSDIQICKYQEFGIISKKDILYGNTIDIGFLISKSDFLEIGCFDESLVNLEDWDFIIRALSIGDAFKIRRYDYAVNIDSNRDRVSSHESLGYVDIAKKYKLNFSDHWFDTMMIKSKAMCGQVPLSVVIRYTLKYRNLFAFRTYISCLMK